MATTKYIDIKIRSRSAEKKVDSLDKSMVRLGKDTDKTSKSFGALSKVATAIGTALSVQQLIKYADAFSSIQNQIRQTTKTTKELTKRTADLLGIANRSRVEFKATSELYTQLNLSTENLNISTRELLRITETISKSFAVSGKSAAESAGSIRQLGQAFAAGVLRGDEFNSIAENAPEIMRALQRSLGKTQGELRALAATGGITSKILVEALGSAADVIDNKMSKATKTFAQAIQEANNNMIDFIGSSTSVKNIVAGAGGALVSASENIELIAKSAVVLASVFAARLIPSMIASTKASVANSLAIKTELTLKADQIKSSLLKLNAEKAETAQLITKNRVLLQSAIASKSAALQEVLRARSINAVTLANLEELKSNALRTKSAAFSAGLRVAAEERVVAANAASIASSLAITKAELNLSAVTAQLTAQKTASTAAISAHTVAKSRATAATVSLSLANKGLAATAVIATTATRALSASMAFLGGPLGVALIAAAAIYTLSDSVDDLKGKVSTATPEMKAFTESIEKMSRGAKGVALANINNEMTTLNSALAENQEKLDNIKVQNSGGLYDKSTIEAANYRAKIKEINDQLDLLSAKQGVIIGAPDLSGGTARGNINDTPEKTTEATKPKESKFAQETKDLQLALALRAAVIQESINAEEASEIIRFTNKANRQQELFTLELEKLGTDEAARIALTEEFRALQLATAQEFEANMTDAKAEGTDDRISLDNDELQSKIQMAQGIVGLMQSFAGKSKKASKALMLIQGALSAYQIYASTEAAAALALAQPPGPPTTIPFAAAISTSGKIKAGAVLAGAATGAFSGGGGGGGGSPSSPISRPSGTTSPSNEAPQQNRIIDIRLDDDAVLTGSAVKQLMSSVLGGDDDITLQITSNQAELTRTGAI
tara:strand:+ start:3964 stop:6660 length:2697 start_codon:yes stop_codon:yes gene_type:complete